MLLFAFIEVNEFPWPSVAAEMNDEQVSLNKLISIKWCNDRFDRFICSYVLTLFQVELDGLLKLD